jgi:hypothetical protein
MNHLNHVYATVLALVASAFFTLVIVGGVSSAGSF